MLRKGGRRGGGRKGKFLTSLGLIISIVLALVSLIDLVYVEKLLKEAKSASSGRVSVLKLKGAIAEELDKRLLVVNTDKVPSLLSDIRTLKQALDEEKSNCKYEVEELEAEWNGKTQLAMQEVTFNKDETLEEMERAWKRERVCVEKEQEALRQVRGALKNQLEDLKRRRIGIEVSRVLGRFFEKTTETYLDAFFDRMRKGNFNNARYELTRASAPSRDGFWRIDVNGEEANLAGGEVPESDYEGFVEALPDAELFGSIRYPRGGYWQTCAVVGSSGMLLRYNQGQAIDGHDAVFRIDDAPAGPPFVDEAGSKTTVRIVGDGRHEQAWEYWRKHRREIILQKIESLDTLTSFTLFKNADPQGTRNVLALAPDFEGFINRFVRGIRMPLGFHGVVLALQKCKSVTVFGFSNISFERLQKLGVQGHYYPMDESGAGGGKGAKGSRGGLPEGLTTSNFDSEELNVVLISQLARRLEGLVKISEPCQTLEESYGGCRNCSVVPLSPLGECIPGVPLPVPAKGNCARADESYHQSDHRVANSFRKCTADEACPGGLRALP
ncbi:hypothetical protein HOP50_20g85250 [Chloropicon primus]|uniref:Sialyltransferase n=1 Tax=Chloropicon primus TaxID=1764295 RepID=A0A5B8N287_9CHLO|nr:hypothetical protein A3770_20p84930 [Chloropicon primus]UPR05175.1 hypothetical protein HOP50_20g85250 [Chloropicon primus]|eukprot:QDZ25975.1 hypothetical protein A3770_20p84930 [Chloropicon primus]